MDVLTREVPQIPQIVMDLLVEKAAQVLEEGGTFTFSIHKKGASCGSPCLVHPS